MKNRKLIYAIVAGFTILTAIYFSIEKSNKSEKQQVEDLPKPSRKVNKVVLDTFFSEKLLKHELDSQNITFPEIVYNQARLETGNFTSNVFKNYHNLFGFMNRNGYIKYTNWRASVVDYRRWQIRYYNGGDYYQFLKNIHYAEDSGYVNKLKRM